MICALVRPCRAAPSEPYCDIPRPCPQPWPSTAIVEVGPIVHTSARCADLASAGTAVAPRLAVRAQAVRAQATRAGTKARGMTVESSQAPRKFAEGTSKDTGPKQGKDLSP